MSRPALSTKEKVLRLAEKFSQKEIADKLDITQARVSQIMNPKKKAKEPANKAVKVVKAPKESLSDQIVSLRAGGMRATDVAQKLKTKIQYVSNIWSKHCKENNLQKSPKAAPVKKTRGRPKKEDKPVSKLSPEIKKEIIKFLETL